MKYILSYKTKFGAVSAESQNPEDLVTAYEHLRSVAEKLLSTREMPSHRKFRRTKNSLRPGGRGETALILRTIQSKLLNSGFFSIPRKTGETRERLVRVSGRAFTSRKVSQALGILWKKRSLRRVGKRNYYAYSAAR